MCSQLLFHFGDFSVWYIHLFLSHFVLNSVQVYKDKQGMMQSVLKLPHWIEIEELDKELNDDREAGDGNSGQPDSDFDELAQILQNWPIKIQHF